MEASEREVVFQRKARNCSVCKRKLKECNKDLCPTKKKRKIDRGKPKKYVFILLLLKFIYIYAINWFVASAGASPVAVSAGAPPAAVSEGASAAIMQWLHNRNGSKCNSLKMPNGEKKRGGQRLSVHYHHRMRKYLVDQRTSQQQQQLHVFSFFFSSSPTSSTTASSLYHWPKLQRERKHKRKHETLISMLAATTNPSLFPSLLSFVFSPFLLSWGSPLMQRKRTIGREETMCVAASSSVM